MKKFLISLFGLTLALSASAQQFNAALAQQQALNGVGVFTNMSAFLGTPWTGANIATATQQTVAFNNLGWGFNASALASPQAPAATTRTYITGSKIAIPAGTLQVGTVLRWHFDITKTAAGTASSTFDICFGTAGTTADTAQVSFTKPAGTAAADEGWIDIEAVVQAVGTSTGVVVGEFRLIHNLESTGHATIPCVCVNTTSSTFNTQTPTFVGVCITTGASDAITINQVSAEGRGL